MSKPAVHIAVFVGERKPSVFSTALSSQERRMIAAWLSEHPDLGELVRSAWKLADTEAENEEWQRLD